MGRARSVLPGLVLALTSLLVTLAALEVLLRLREGALTETRNLVLPDRSEYLGAGFTLHHPVLGWIPKPGFRGRGAELGWRLREGTAPPGTNEEATVSILEHGIRANGPAPPDGPVRVLAVGDSFTFGDQVSDAETWPARLEAELGVGVANAGVYAYGLDQALLRAELLTPVLEPSLVVLAFIRADIFRTHVSRRSGAAKPWFEIRDAAGADEKLVLRNTPVPEPIDELDRWRRLGGYSYLADLVMSRLAPEYWHAGPMRLGHDRPHEVSCLLMERLGRLRRDARVQVLAVGLPGAADDPFRDEVATLLACARRGGAATLDLYPVLAEPDAGTGDGTPLFFGHLTPAGNARVARHVAEAIRRQGLLASPDQ